MVRPVEAELLKLFVHLLQLLRTQHVVASLLVDGADEDGVWIARLCLGSQLETENGGKEDPQVRHENSFSIVVFAVRVFMPLLPVSYALWLQMLPNVLHLLQISVVVQLDEAELRHDLLHGHLADSCIQVAFKLQ